MAQPVPKRHDVQSGQRVCDAGCDGSGVPSVGRRDRRLLAANAQAEEGMPEGKARSEGLVFCGRCTVGTVGLKLRNAADTTPLWPAKNSPPNVVAKRKTESSVEPTPRAP